MAAVSWEGTCAVGSILSGALSWLVVVTMGLAPMLVYWLAWMIGRAMRCKAPVHRRVARWLSRRTAGERNGAM
jgi:predicted Na+-dependent transporter